LVLYDGEQVAGAKCVRVDWQEDNNKRKIMKEVPESEFFIEADLIILSMGFLSDEIKVLPEGVFVAGDKATGASLVCKAIQQGRQAAASIDEYFIKKRKGER
jgi:glutamate synthase (NADPH/NADH) small chain